MRKKEQIQIHNPFLTITAFDILNKLFPDAKYIEMIVNLIKNTRVKKNGEYSKREIISHYGESVLPIFEGRPESEYEYVTRLLESILCREQLNTISKFIQYDKQKLINGVDFTSLKSYEDLKKINSLCEIKQMGNELEKEIIKLLEDDEWLVMRPLTHMSSMKYGSSTKWCTTSENEPNYFSRYTKNGALIYCINKKTGLKVAAHKNYDERSSSFWNMEDDRIDSLDTGLPYSILDLVRSEINKNKTNHDLMSEELRDKEALYLIRFEYEQHKTLGISEPMQAIPLTAMDEVANEVRNTLAIEYDLPVRA